MLRTLQETGRRPAHALHCCPRTLPLLRRDAAAALQRDAQLHRRDRHGAHTTREATSVCREDPRAPRVLPRVLAGGHGLLRAVVAQDDREVPRVEHGRGGELGSCAQCHPSHRAEVSRHFRCGKSNHNYREKPLITLHVAYIYRHHILGKCYGNWLCAGSHICLPPVTHN